MLFRNDVIDGAAVMLWIRFAAPADKIEGAMTIDGFFARGRALSASGMDLN